MVKLQQLKTVLRLLRFSSSSCRRHRRCPHQFAIRRSLRLLRYLLFIIAQNVQQKGTEIVKLASNEDTENKSKESHISV